MTRDFLVVFQAMRSGAFDVGSFLGRAQGFPQGQRLGPATPSRLCVASPFYPGFCRRAQSPAFGAGA